jgi:hypothetical protein
MTPEELKRIIGAPRSATHERARPSSDDCDWHSPGRRDRTPCKPLTERIAQLEKQIEKIERRKYVGVEADCASEQDWMIVPSIVDANRPPEESELADVTSRRKYRTPSHYLIRTEHFLLSDFDQQFPQPFMLSIPIKSRMPASEDFDCR